MIQFAVAFLVSFTTVGLKITQQQNVNHGHKSWAVVCSFLMAACDVSLVGLVVKSSWWVWIPIGSGAALGCVLSMHFYPKRK